MQFFCIIKLTVKKLKNVKLQNIFSYLLGFIFSLNKLFEIFKLLVQKLSVKVSSPFDWTFNDHLLCRTAKNLDQIRSATSLSYTLNYAKSIECCRDGRNCCIKFLMNVARKFINRKLSFINRVIAFMTFMIKIQGPLGFSLRSKSLKGVKCLMYKKQSSVWDSIAKNHCGCTKRNSWTLIVVR